MSSKESNVCWSRFVSRLFPLRFWREIQIHSKMAGKWLPLPKRRQKKSQQVKIVSDASEKENITSNLTQIAKKQRTDDSVTKDLRRVYRYIAKETDLFFGIDKEL